MCGITGFWSARRLADEAERQLDGMMQTLAHRGPDGTGQYLDAARGVALGHTRLSINDLGETGAQPLQGLGGRFVLVANGELYDFKRMRSTLMALGDRFASKSDNELAISLYEKYGLDFVHQLRGEFAIALYDRQEDSLILVRDRFGIRPLFWHLADNTFYFGSETKSILAHPAVSRRMCPKALLNQLMHTMVPGTSAFDGIQALEPGHLLVVNRRDGRLELDKRRYWDLDFPVAEARDASVDAEEHIARIRDRLVESILLRLEADVPVGCYLSGGIDSCAILGLATGAQQSPVKAFTISFDSDEYDEGAIATEMAESMRAEQELIRLTADELYGDNYIRTAWHAERTFYNTLGVAKYRMSKRVHECGYKTVITGEGADELFAGYPAFKRDMFQHGLAGLDPGTRAEYQRALEEANRIFRGAILSENPMQHPAFDRLCGFTPSWIQPWISTLELVRPLLHADLQAELADYDPVAAIADALDPTMIEERHALDKAQYTWSKTMLEGQILNWGGDRVDMANSMESRPAFLDHTLAEAAVQVPPELRIRGTTEKWILREAVKGVLPELLYKRPKFAFMAPPAHTDERKAARVDQLIARYLSPDALRRAGLLDTPAVGAFLDGYRGDRDPVSLVRKDALLNHLLCVQILHEQFIERRPSAPPSVNEPS